VNTIDLDVQGMICGSCVARVMAALSTIDGVEDVQVDLHAGTVRVTSAATVAPSQLIAALAARRYDTSVITHVRPVIIKVLTAL
jgi:copper chaperone